jgi:alpha-galactosidase
MEAWVTDQGQDYLSLDFRFHASMCGSLGISVHPDRWSEEERARAARWIGLYKEIRPIVQLGGQYRLRSPQHHSFSALQYVAKDRSESILFAFRTHLPEAATLPLLYLRGLDPAAHYEVEGISGIRSGASWMYSGLELHLHNFESTVRRIRRVEM